jgi:hypothetical protein
MLALFRPDLELPDFVPNWSRMMAEHTITPSFRSSSVHQLENF